MKKGIVAAVAAVALLAGTVALADGPEGERGGHNPFGYVISQLDLTDAQQAIVDAWREEARAEREEMRAEREQARETMKAELTGGSPDPAVLHHLVDERFAAQEARAHEMVDNFLDLYATFTPAQKAELAEILEEGPPEGPPPSQGGRPGEGRGRWER